jgi:hypothetical protein
LSFRQAAGVIDCLGVSIFSQNILRLSQQQPDGNIPPAGPCTSTIVFEILFRLKEPEKALFSLSLATNHRGCALKINKEN